MSAIYVLAHYDDEYGAWPLIRADIAAGRRPVVLHLTRPVRGAPGAVRRAESVKFLMNAGVAAEDIIDLSAETDAPDGALLGKLEGSLLGLRRHALAAGPIERIVTPAWEGGHLDHDLCAVLAVALAQDLGSPPPILQFSLYHGRRTLGQWFRGADPIPENGPTRRLRIRLRDWAAFAGLVGAFPSQAPVFSTLWPAMFSTFLRRGFLYQDLAHERVLERPHAGRLLYERRRRGDYLSVHVRVKDFLAQRAPAAGGERRSLRSA